ncbi:hypothetical protein PCANB_001053 [Pneumocystis canis]|nr:hypothetical protein PCK1_001096 [Pneumocystis canis]KAG5437260.1 hypothetical protein PCANB_001053 [Pneumocystis canis]
MEPVVFFKKKRTKKIRQKENDSESESEIVVKSKKVNFQTKYSITAGTNTISSLTNETGNITSASYTVDTVSDSIIQTDRVINRPGPVQTKHLMPTTFIDYAPDVCKDYKQTGFCGFGDSCKFLHDREDYKAGWQLDREWEEIQHKKRIETLYTKDLDNQTQVSCSDEEEIPFACFICRKEYVQPIVTKCGHYFCEECAIRRYRKHPTCIICGAGTSGIFNAAKKLEQKLLKKKQLSHEKSSSNNIALDIS